MTNLKTSNSSLFMPIYKNLPRERPKAKALPLYRPIDRLFLILWARRRALAPFFAAAVVLALVYLGFRIYANSYERRAAALYKTGDLEGAALKFPRSRSAGMARMKLGGEGLKDGRYDEAISWYLPVVSESARLAVLRIAALQNLGLAYAKKGDWENAIASLERAISDRENAAPDWSRFLLAKIFERKGEKGRAEEIYKSLAEGTEVPGLKEEVGEKLSSWNKEQEKK